VLSGDHIYNMAYAEMLDYHVRNNADLTIATQPVPWDEASRFGVLKSDKKGRVEMFQEKPKDPASNQANLGIYIFKRSVLEERLREDAANPESSHDFGKDIIPKMIAENAPCYAFEFLDYWRDVGTLQSFWEANMDCLDPASGLDLARWKVHTNCLSDSMQFCMPTLVHSGGSVVHSTVGKDSEISGTVINSILFRGVKVAKGAVVRNSIIMDDAEIGPGAIVEGLISDKHMKIGANARIGDSAPDAAVNKLYPDYLNTGLALFGKNVRVPEGCRIGRNCLVYGGSKEDRFPSEGLADGATLSAKGVDVD
jgi:glucose-1-phosphate adenylyltransferase